MMMPMMMVIVMAGLHELQLALRFCEKGGHCTGQSSGDMLSHTVLLMMVMMMMVIVMKPFATKTLFC